MPDGQRNMSIEWSQNVNVQRDDDRKRLMNLKMNLQSLAITCLTHLQKSSLKKLILKFYMS